MTVSFSLEGRDFEGRKKSAFYSLTTTRKATLGPAGFSLEESEMLRCLLSKRVVRATYLDALDRQILGPDGVRKDLKAILNAYDQRLVQILSPKRSDA